MDLEQTTTGETSESQSPLDLIASIGTSPKPDTQVEEAPVTDTVQSDLTPVAEPAKTDENPTQTELERLQRVIAADPNLRANYLADKFGHLQPQPIIQQQPVYQQPQQPVQQQLHQYQAPPVQQTPALPFQPEDYDPFNLDHQQAVMNMMLQRQLQPFSEFVQSQQRENQILAQQAQQQRVNGMEANIQEKLNESIPGFNEAFKPTATFDQKIIKNAAISAFSEAMQAYPQEYWGSDAVHQEVIQKISPQLNTLAQRLGVSAQASSSSAQKQAMAREMNVVSSNAVPSNQSNPFDTAAKKKDTLGMIAALNRK